MRFRRALAAFALLSSLAAYAQPTPPPSLQYTMAGFYGDVFTGRVTYCQTVYLLGRNTREEWPDAVHASIRNYDRHYQFVLDLKAKVYTATELDERGLPLNPPPDSVVWKCSGRTHLIHIETVDTGQRRVLFGYPARRVKSRRTDTIAPLRDVSLTTEESDGWFIEPAAWRELHQARTGGEARGVAYVGVVSTGYAGEMDEIRITREGPGETGLPVIRKGRYNYDRVIDLSEEALNPALFQPPPDFKRVPELPHTPHPHPYPWSTALTLRWLMLTDWL